MKQHIKEKNNSSLYDAMPALWKNLTIEERNSIIVTIDKAFSTLDEGDTPWNSKDFLLSLSQFVELKNVPKLQVCHQVAKRDPAVITEQRFNLEESSDDCSVEETNVSNTHTKQQQNSDLLDNLGSADKKSAQYALYNHMIKYRSRCSYQEKEQKVSEYLHCEVTCDQQKLLNPSVLDTIVGYVMQDSQGEGTKKRLPQRRLNFIKSTVSSHCRVQNSKERLVLIRQANEVAGVLGDLETDRLLKKAEQKKKRAEEEATLEERRIKKITKDKESMETALLTCSSILCDININGVLNFNSLKVDDLKSMIRYHFKSDEYKTKGIKNKNCALSQQDYTMRVLCLQLKVEMYSAKREERKIVCLLFFVYML